MFGKIKKLWKKEKKVMAILNIEGPISAAGEGRFRKEGGTQEILDFLYALLDKDERLDGLLIRMNTPGGAAAASEEVALLLDRVHDCLCSGYHICHQRHYDRFHRMYYADSQF